MKEEKNFILIREGQTEEEIQVFLNCSPREFAHLMFSFFASSEGEAYYKEVVDLFRQTMKKNNLYN